MAENIAIQAFRTALGISAEEAHQVVYEHEGQGISRLKVNELKDVIRLLKAQGYYKVHLGIAANKPELIAMLRAVAALEKDGGADVPQTAAPQQNPARNPANTATLPAAAVTGTRPVNVATQNAPAHVPAPPNAAANAARQAAAPVQPTFYSPPKVAQPAPSTQPAQPANTTSQSKSSSHKKATPNKPSSNHPGHLYTPKPGDDPNHRARLFRVLQGPRLTAFNMLKQIPGVTEIEILDELEVQPTNAALDIDDVLFNIVTKRESGETGVMAGDELGEDELDALQEQENRDVDRAIRESEQERDVIQQRKRNRVEELRTGLDGYLNTEEYQRSVLLFGCCGAKGDADIAVAGTEERPMKVQRTGSNTGSIGGTATSSKYSSASLTQQAVLMNNSAYQSTTAGPTSGTINSNSASSSNSHVLSNKSNSTSSYAYSSTSNHSYHSHTNTSNNGNNSSSSVVDLTLDSESEDERAVLKSTSDTHSRSIASNSLCSNISSKGENRNNTAINSSSGGSGPFSQPVYESVSINGSNSSYSSNNIPTTTSTTNAATTSKPNMSRSRIVHKLAHLLDQIHDKESIDNLTSPSGSNGSSSSSNAGMLTQPVNLHRRIYDITYVQNCTSQCISMLNSLRPVLSNLLLVETEATKYYENTSVAYLVHTARRIDGKLLCHTVDEAINNTVVKSGPTTNTTLLPGQTKFYPNDCIYYLPLIERYIKHTSIVALLTHEAEKLQKGMHKLQTDGQLVPYIFRSPRIAYYARALAASIDTDGLEVLDTSNGNSNNAGSKGTTSSTDSSVPVASKDILREGDNNENENNVVDRCMDSSSEESVASPYNSDDDDF